MTLGAVCAATLALEDGTLALLRPGLHEARLSSAGRDVVAGAGREFADQRAGFGRRIGCTPAEWLSGQDVILG